MYLHPCPNPRKDINMQEGEHNKSGRRQVGQLLRHMARRGRSDGRGLSTGPRASSGRHFEGSRRKVTRDSVNAGERYQMGEGQQGAAVVAAEEELVIIISFVRVIT